MERIDYIELCGLILKLYKCINTVFLYVCFMESILLTAYMYEMCACYICLCKRALLVDTCSKLTNMGR